MYPEGGYSSLLRKSSQKYARKHHLPELKCLALPRIGCMKAIFDELAPINGKCHLDYVVDITTAIEIEYDLERLRIRLRGRNRVGFLYRVYRADEVNFRLFTCTRNGRALYEKQQIFFRFQEMKCR